MWQRHNTTFMNRHAATAVQHTLAHTKHTCHNNLFCIHESWHLEITGWVAIPCSHILPCRIWWSTVTSRRWEKTEVNPFEYLFARMKINRKKICRRESEWFSILYSVFIFPCVFIHIYMNKNLWALAERWIQNLSSLVKAKTR